MKTKALFLLIAGLMLVFVATSCKKKKTEVNTSCVITGTVIENPTGNPVSNATVTLSPSGKNTYTGSDGHFEFIDLDEAQYTMTVQKIGYVTNRKIVTLSAGSTQTVSITLEKEPE